MKTTILIAVAGLFLAIVVPSVIVTPTSSTAQRGGTELVGRLATADKVLSIYSDGRAPYFSVVSRSGLSLGRHLDESTFQKRFPNLYRDFSEGIAGLHAGLGSHYQDSTVPGTEFVPGF